MASRCPKGLEPFCEEYIADNGYWYIPKGFTIKEDNFSSIVDKLRILQSFEGQSWSIAQSKFVKKLTAKELFERRVKGQNSQDKTAIGRMYAVVARFLGLAWVNENENISITAIGKKLLHSSKGTIKKIINSQISRFQFYNPSFPNKDGFNDIQIIPIQFLCEIFGRLKTNYIDKYEYILFLAKKKTFESLDKACEEIKRYRALSDDDKDKLLRHLDKTDIFESGNERRTSIYNTIKLEAPYALNFFASSGIFVFDEAKLSLNCAPTELKRKIELFKKTNLWIDFKSDKDWFYYYGAAAFTTAIDFAMDYYLDISDFENGSNAFDIAKKRGIKTIDLDNKQEFKSVMIDEKILEDFLEKNLNQLEPDLKLVAKGRQYETISGPIDLLAKDSKGNHVIIELKKGRVSDRVIGQVSRYAAFVGNNLTTLNKVRAIIVGKQIDRNLSMSASMLSIQCNIYEFEYKFRFDKKR